MFKSERASKSRKAASGKAYFEVPRLPGIHQLEQRHFLAHGLAKARASQRLV